MTIPNDTAKLALLHEIYDSVEEGVESFEHDDMVGPDLAYLLGAVLHERYCEWPAERRIVQLLRDHFAPDHAVWNYLHLEQDEEDPMKKLSKAQEHQKQRLCAEAEEKRDALDQQVQCYNQAVAEEWAKVETKLADVNDTIGSLNAFIDDITDEMDGYLSERSERWQESDAGRDYDAWKQQWQEAKLSEAEMEAPAEAEVPEVPVEQVRDLSDSPE